MGGRIFKFTSIRAKSIQDTLDLSRIGAQENEYKDWEEMVNTRKISG